MKLKVICTSAVFLWAMTTICNSQGTKGDGAAPPMVQSFSPTSSSQSDERYSISSEGVIRDRFTTLEWLVGPDQNMKHQEAVSWVADCKISGGGWRMPTVKELRGLYVKGMGAHNVHPAFKTSNKWLWVWAGETRDQESAWYFFFANSSVPLEIGDGWVYVDNRNNDPFRVFGVRSARMWLDIHEDLMGM